MKGSMLVGIVLMLLVAGGGWFAITQRPGWFQRADEAAATVRMEKAAADCLERLDGGSAAGDRKLDRGSLTPAENDKLRACVEDILETRK